MIKTLNKVGIKGNYLNIIKAIYEKLPSHSPVKGWKAFLRNRGKGVTPAPVSAPTGEAAAQLHLPPGPCSRVSAGPGKRPVAVRKQRAGRLGACVRWGRVRGHILGCVFTRVKRSIFKDWKYGNTVEGKWR